MPKSKNSRKAFLRLLLLCSASVFLLFLSAMYCGTTLAMGIDLKHLEGQWQGEWRPYEKKYQHNVGSLPMTFVVTDKLELSGNIGGTSFLSHKTENQEKQFLVYAKLSKPIAFAPDAPKDHLIIIMTKIDQDQLVADVHFKSRFGFDFSMHPGELKARKAK